ncbi:MAG: DUF3431 domain-containing protein [Candidatus Zambryskibacteria bacterium]|nr:DUF3431 domain-containing protein [Candidatus Zambryskibacteria bacterium]
MNLVMNLKMTMVISRYRENLDWLKELPWNYIIYDKGEDNLPSWVKNVVKLPNIGRESHTYLAYIIDNYDNLPDYTIFLQDKPLDHSKELIKKINNFKGECDFFALSDDILYADGYGGPHHFGLKIAESARKIFLNKIDFFEFPAGAQFIVSKKAILFHAKMTYQRIMDFMIREKPYVEDEYRFFSPWVLERLWKTLFDMEHKTIYD